uniref:Nucleolar GTP-binding protein 1 n=1 Tax=Tanacetum cinerariifolium TaxID=118510 RepID=A0A6L2NKU4_TANCI|nr:nucleolar GTP-binding protein 1 [Tanacetum cinerariifolium]
MVMPSVDILHLALRKARRVTPTRGIKNAAKREKNEGTKHLDALMKELTLPSRTYKENFPNKRHLHPYERSLIELTLGDGNYEEVGHKVDSLREKVGSVGKELASLCAQSTSKREAEERLAEGFKRLENIYRSDGKAIDELMQIAKTSRAMPVVDLEMPTLCLVGAPNVGNHLDEYHARVHVKSKPHYFPLMKDRLGLDQCVLFRKKVFDNDHYDLPLIYNVNGHTLHFGRREFCLITGFKFGMLSFRKFGEGDISFHDRVFREKIGEYVKNIDLLSVFEDEERFTNLSDEDSIRVCLLLSLEVIFMGHALGSAIDDVFLRMVDNLEAWNDFPWGEHI